MGSGKREFEPSPEPEATTIEEENLSTAQEAISIPLLVGQRKIALRWISRVYNQYAVGVPAARPGKK